MSSADRRITSVDSGQSTRRQQPAKRRLSDRVWLLIGAIVFLAEIVITVAVLAALMSVKGGLLG